MTNSNKCQCSNDNMGLPSESQGRELWTWRCQLCGETGAAKYPDWRSASRAAGDSHVDSECELLIELTRRSEPRTTSASQLPVGSVVANQDVTWTKRDPRPPFAVVSSEYPWEASQWHENGSDKEIDDLLVSGGAEILRVGSEKGRV